MVRDMVYKIINQEREYQDNLSEERTDGHIHSVGEELILLNVYLRKAMDAWADNPGDTYALDQIRKIAAIAVRCMENHGAPPRANF